MKNAHITESKSKRNQQATEVPDLQTAMWNLMNGIWLTDK